MLSILYKKRFIMDFKEFGKFIKNTRKEQNISQEELCQDLQISRVTLSNFENARKEIGFKKVLQIVDYLGLQMSLKEKSLFPTLEDLRDE